MHRTHTAEQVGTRRWRRSGAPGSRELSLDLIFGLPAALGSELGADLDRAVALGPEHLSLYGLTVEDHTPLGRWTARGEVAPVDEDRYAAEFLEADRGARRAGFEHYEVSNYGRPGRRARHNSAYWRRAPFIGLGPSAHSGLGAAAPVEPAGVGGLRARRGSRAESGSRFASGWTTRRSSWRSCTSASGPVRGSPPSACRQEIGAAWARQPAGPRSPTAGFG